MFVGHYGIGFAAKKINPAVPLWVLFIAVQLLDLAWAPLVLLGIEKVRIVPGITAASPLDLYYIPFSHSLVAALLWSAAAFAFVRWLPRGPGSGTAWLVAGAVFSHWILDLIVHRPDLPLWDDRAKVGLGLWNLPAVAFVLEAAFLFGGLWLYLKTGPRRRGPVAAFALFMLAVQSTALFGPPPPTDKAVAVTALASYAAFAAVIWLLEDPKRRLRAGGT